MADKLRTQQLLEQLQARYVGTGHADTTAEEWKLTIMRDSAVSMADHPSLLRIIAMGSGQSMARTRTEMLEKLVKPMRVKKEVVAAAEPGP